VKADRETVERLRTLAQQKREFNQLARSILNDTEKQIEECGTGKLSMLHLFRRRDLMLTCLARLPTPEALDQIADQLEAKLRG
jgi:hypothetical protein